MSTGKRRRRGGFTLVELLVVISIIGMLMALLLPAVQNARETARSNTCRNNMRNMTIAVFEYEQQRRRFPGYINYVPLGQPTTGLFVERSWQFMILPYLEYNTLYSAYAGTGAIYLNGEQPTQQIELFLCPSDPPDGTNNLPPCSYAANTGLRDVDVPNADGTPADWPGNGVFHDARAINPFVGSPPPYTVVPISSVNASYVGTGDGTQNTVLLAENTDIQSWVPFPTPPTSFLGDNTQASPLYERQLGIVWQPTCSPASSIAPPAGLPDGIPAPAPQHTINGQIGLDPDMLDIGYARPGAYHPNGANVAFCDTHVRFISQDINYGVWCLLMTPRGRQARDPGELLTDPSDPFDPGYPDPYFRYTQLDEVDFQ